MKNITENINIWEKGFIAVPKQMLEEYIGKQKESLTELEAMMIIEARVNYKDQLCDIAGVKEVCKRGESFYSVCKWSELFHWERGKTRSFLSKLEKTGFIELIPHPKTTHLRVLTYDSQQMCSTNKPERASSCEDEEFKAFWCAYHEITQTRKRNVGRARREWNMLTLEEKGLAMKGIEDYYYNLTNINYCKQAASYLRDKSFLDED